jgi:hypothetical protein
MWWGVMLADDYGMVLADGLMNRPYAIRCMFPLCVGGILQIKKAPLLYYYQ